MAISSVSYTKTPQAGDDSYWYTEDELLAASNYNSSSNVLTLNVMSNDLGGNAKKLYSIDDGSGALSDLLASNVTTGWETTLGGNQIRINAGKIEFRFATGLDSLAVGDTRHDSFVYAIQLGNGTISYATVTVDVMGSNDGPRVSAAVTAGGIEGGADFEVDLLQGASDIDQGETATLQASGLSFSVNGGPSSGALPAGLTLVGNKLLVDADGSAFDHLAAGATEVITVSYFVEDVHGASVAQTATITITGTNDAAVLSADVANLSETDLAADISTSGTLTISDVDSPESFVAQAGTVGLYGAFSINAAGEWSYSATSAHNEFVAGETYTDTFTVSSADGTLTSVTINILGSDDPVVGPVDSNAAANLVLENAAVGSVVGLTAFATDADAGGQAITYTLSDDAGGRFAIDSSTGIVTV
ncbi:VCBS domain-containing protein, partial [Vogesella indigofera]|uniref:VCBS domain-containing protein n=1 Tax=Vogesella indigofera TaxID=45465 RepID=UPI003F43DF19